MRLAIIGSRTFNDYSKLATIIQGHFYYPHLNEFFISEIISGGAKGADKLAEDYAENWSLKITVLKPDWNKYGKSAGFRRNQQIVDACDIVLAFWDGKSKGTQDSINKAKLAKKPTFIVYV